MVIHVSGQDWFRAKLFVDEQILAYEKKKFVPFRASILDESWFEQINMMATTDSLFSQKYFIVLSLDMKKGRAKDAEDQELNPETTEHIKWIVQAFLDSEHTLLVWNRGAKSGFPSKSKKIQTEDFPSLKEDDMIAWTVSFAKQHGITVSKIFAYTLTQACSNDTALIAHEIEKLALFGSADEKTLLSYSPLASYFDWMQNFLKGDWKARADILRFDEHEASQRLAGLLNAVRIILIARSKNSVERTQFMQSTNQYWVRSLLSWSQEIETQKIEQWFVHLIRYDILVRRYKMTEPEALEKLAFSAME